MVRKRRGVSYQKRLADIDRIYSKYVAQGLSNREIWRRYIYPVYGISERTMYNLFNAVSNPTNAIDDDMMTLFDFKDEDGN